MKTTSAYIARAQQSDRHRGTAAGMFALALSDFWR